MIPAVMPTYARYDIAFEHGEGPYLFDTAGRRYLDFAGGIAVVALGHAHPHLVAALTEQARTLWHTSNLYRIPGQERLAERLVAATFADSCFFANSGLEAVECGLKMVRRYHDATGHPERYRVITFAGAFHGRSLATLAAGRQAKHLEGYDPVVDGFDQVGWGNLNELKAAIGPETAAVLMEPVQGEGGIRVPPGDFLRACRAVCDEFGLLLFLDEVQTGMGRTGRLFAHQWTGVAPDILAAAKGLGGGFPVGACLATEAVARTMTPGSHGSTFGGNPLAMAVANAVLDVVLADGFLKGVDATARALWPRLEALVDAHPKVFAEARGSGLMLGLRCAGDPAAVIAAARTAGLLLAPAGERVVRLLPPLTIGPDHVDEALAALDRAAAAVEEQEVAG